MPEILSQSSAEAWYALEALKSNFILVCCCFHLRHAKNVLFIPSKCLLKAYSINEVLSVVEMRLLMPVHNNGAVCCFRDSLACDMLLWWAAC